MTTHLHHILAVLLAALRGQDPRRELLHQYEGTQA
jgi:hypothetical protein